MFCQGLRDVSLQSLFHLSGKSSGVRPNTWTLLGLKAAQWLCKTKMSDESCASSSGDGEIGFYGHSTLPSPPFFRVAAQLKPFARAQQVLRWATGKNHSVDAC